MEHPKALIELWVDELMFAFEQTERRYRRAVDRGAPREAALRDLLSRFLPRKVGVASGHVIASTPAWSQQCDIIIYDRLEAPIFSRDEGHQGSVIPAESVYGIFEVKSVLTLKEFKKATASIQSFKRLCGRVRVGAHVLSDRFGAIVAYRVPGDTQAEKDKHVERLVAYARTLPDSERPDDVLILGNVAGGQHSGGCLVSLLPQGSPDAKVFDYVKTSAGRRNLQILLARLLDERLRRVRTGMPDNHLRYLFQEGIDIHETGADKKAQRNIGASPVNDELAGFLNAKAKFLGGCPICGGKRLGALEDVYYLITAKDFHFGKLGAPYLPIVVTSCTSCGHLQLFSAKDLGLVP